MTHPTHGQTQTHPSDPSDRAPAPKAGAPKDAPPAERILDATHVDPTVLDTALGNAQSQIVSLGGTATITDPNAKAASEAPPERSRGSVGGAHGDAHGT